MTLKEAGAVIGVLTLGVVGGRVVYSEAEYTAKVQRLEAKYGQAFRDNDARRPGVNWWEARLEEVDPGEYLAVTLTRTSDGGQAVIAHRESVCVIPDCSTSDGGWDDNHAQVACLGIGPYGRYLDGGPTWRGCNVIPRQFTQGSACLPASCSTDGESLLFIREGR